MNGQTLAKLGQEARKNGALDRPTKFEEEARIKLYDKYEHITDLKLVESEY